MTDRSTSRDQHGGGYGPADRKLFETVAAALYEDAVTQGGLKTDDARLSEGSEQRPAFDLLVDLGLLALDQDGERYRAHDPAASQARVVAPLGRRGAELITESSQWAQTFAALSQAWRRSPVPAQDAFTEIHGLPAITKFLEDTVKETTVDVLTAQPQGVRAPMDRRMAMARFELDAMERGVVVRTLYQHSARRDADTHKYVQFMSAKGAEIRTLDEFFHRMFIFDRTIAIIPNSASTESAIVIREPSVVAYLADIYERTWERARPFGNQEPDTLRNIATQQRAMTIRMLIRGYPDPASAKRLGVSQRTYASYVADLKAEYDAETRFQLGYYMGQRGITGDDKAPTKNE
jgi:sugar-specific transcriptional regulator TrmB